MIHLTLSNHIISALPGFEIGYEHFLFRKHSLLFNYQRITDVLVTHKVPYANGNLRGNRFILDYRFSIFPANNKLIPVFKTPGEFSFFISGGVLFRTSTLPLKPDFLSANHQVYSDAYNMHVTQSGGSFSLGLRVRYNRIGFEAYLRTMFVSEDIEPEGRMNIEDRIASDNFAGYEFYNQQGKSFILNQEAIARLSFYF